MERGAPLDGACTIESLVMPSVEELVTARLVCSSLLRSGQREGVEDPRKKMDDLSKAMGTPIGGEGL